MTEHTLKCWPEHYAEIEAGTKTCELRLADRPYQRGDVLLLREWEPVENGYMGRQLRVRVMHVLSGGPWLSPGYVAMSIRLMGEDGRTRVQEDFRKSYDDERKAHDKTRCWARAWKHAARKEQDRYQWLHGYAKRAIQRLRARADAAERQLGEARAELKRVTNDEAMTDIVQGALVELGVRTRLDTGESMREFCNGVARDIIDALRLHYATDHAPAALLHADLSSRYAALLAAAEGMRAVGYTEGIVMVDRAAYERLKGAI